MIRIGVPDLQVIRDALNQVIAQRDRLREDYDTLREASDAVIAAQNDDLRRIRAERDRLRAALEILAGSIQAATNKDDAPMSASEHLHEALRVAAAVGSCLFSQLPTARRQRHFASR